MPQIEQMVKEDGRPGLRKEKTSSINAECLSKLNAGDKGVEMFDIKY